jgi:hypothetical protein
MSLFDMLESAAGTAAMGQIAQRVGLPPDQLQAVIGSLAPKVLPKLHQKAQQGELDTSAAASAPPPGTDEAEDHGNSILGSIFGSKQVSRSVAQETSDSTGVSIDKIKQVLPQLASVAAAAMQRGQLGQSTGGLGSILAGMES